MMPDSKKKKQRKQPANSALPGPPFTAQPFAKRLWVLKKGRSKIAPPFLNSIDSTCLLRQTRKKFSDPA